MTLPAPTHDRPLARRARQHLGNAGWCLRCGFPWLPHATEQHVTHFNASEGCFPLCRFCFSELTIPEREPYYWALIRSWDATTPMSEETVAQILAAVRAGR